MADVFALESVSVAYDDHDALRSLSLAATGGERIGLVGPNGAGKTTLLHVLAGLRETRLGDAVVLGCRLSDRTGIRSLRGRVGLVFQNADDQLFCGSVFEDVAFGPLNLGLDDSEVRARVHDALNRVGAAGIADRISHHLSAGEKRRVAIAASLSMSPELLLLDEPTGELDPRGRRELIHLLRELNQTLVIATHDLEFVLETCDRAVVLDEGRKLADGAPADVLGDARLMEQAGLEVPHSLRAPATQAADRSCIRAARAG